MVDPLQAARRIRLQNEEETRKLKVRRARAQDFGRELAQIIINAHPEVGRVWGFGSAFETWRSFRMTSDVDLAVESGDIIDLFLLVENREFSVDVIDLSSCHASMANFIRDQGTVLAGET